MTQNALAIAREKAGDKTTRRVRAKSRVEENGQDTTVWLGITKAELEKARPGTGQHRGIGFSLTTEFELPNDGGAFALATNWMTITAR